ncbi:MAG TPA: CehA/McbA family metallohydrolase [Vicinamibacterales bacterium]
MQSLAFRRLALAASLVITLLIVRHVTAPAMATSQTAAGARWLKGNTHTHTTESDGDSPPDDVARWYRDHGYDFLVLSDHNKLTAVDALNALHGADGKFLLIRGEEVTDRFEGKHVHVNGLDIPEKIDPQKGSSLIEVLQRNVDAVRRVGGVPHINHPNFQWSLTADDLLRTQNYRLLEIFNGHPQVNNLGGGGVPGLEEMWDVLLTSGTLVYGIAVDDAHTFKQPGNPAVAGPGRGWVMVRANRFDARAIVGALDAGDFYASTGVELADYVVTPKSMTVTVKKDTWSKYRVQFIGKEGRVLHEALDSPAEYAFKGNESYVRAKVLESNGRVAWCQPVRVPVN